MNLVLKVTSEQRAGLGQSATFTFGESGGSIGRSARCDWVLPDPDNTLSARHAEITSNGRGFLITDTSTNGVYINALDGLLGRGNSSPLTDGDTLYIGDFVVSVTIDKAPVAAERPRMPPRPVQQPADAAAMRGAPSPGMGQWPAADMPPPPPPPLVAGLNDGRRASPPADTFAGAAAPSRLGSPLPPTTAGIPDDFDMLSPVLPARPGFAASVQPNGAVSRGPGVPNGSPLSAPPSGLIPNGQGFALPPMPAPAPPAPLAIIPADLDFDALLSGIGAPPAQTGGGELASRGFTSPPLPPPLPIVPAAPVQPPAPPPFSASLPTPAFDTRSTPAPPLTNGVDPGDFAVPPPPLGMGLLPDLPFESGPFGGLPMPVPVGVTAAPAGAAEVSDPFVRGLPSMGAPLPAATPPAPPSEPDKVTDPMQLLRQRAAQRAATMDLTAVDPEAINGVDRRTVFAPALPAPPAPPAMPMPTPMPIPRPTASTGMPLPGGDVAADAGVTDALADLFVALQVDLALVPPERRRACVMEVGRALRLLIDGMVGILGARRSLKEEFRMDQTQLSASENNPLKFYKSADEVLRKTLGEPKPGFMPLDEAVRQGLIDLKAHEIASATALQSIFMRLLETFDPQQFESEGGGLLGRRTDKGKAYDQFVDSYRRMAANPDRAARDIVGPEFARAYADALQRLKTMER